MIDRMPMILSCEDKCKWLNQEQPVEGLKAMLQPFPVAEMKAYTVCKAIGNVKNRGPELIEEIK
jgi:putative SOS response-associated peptidase YedK